RHFRRGHARGPAPGLPRRRLSHGPRHPRQARRVSRLGGAPPPGARAPHAPGRPRGRGRDGHAGQPRSPGRRRPPDRGRARRHRPAAAGRPAGDGRAAPANDLVGVIAAGPAEGAGAAAAAAEPLLARAGRDTARGARSGPRTLAGAARRAPEANLALISVPGALAAPEARTALTAGLNVMLFSDNVSLADEIALKRGALERGLLLMGPDCGTAYVAGVPLGFANAVPRGEIGIVAASGTGLQQVASLLAGRGRGVSHAI